MEKGVFLTEISIDVLSDTPANELLDFLQKLGVEIEIDADKGTVRTFAQAV